MSPTVADVEIHNAVATLALGRRGRYAVPMTQPRHRPDREVFIVHVGTAMEPATLPEWWGAIGSDVESRRLRFGDGGDNWLPEDALPGSLQESGGRLADVEETLGRSGLTDPGLSVGQAVVLRPEPHPTDPNAIAVWSAGQQQVGYLLGEIAAETMRESQRRQNAYKAIVAGEQRDKASGERRSVTILLGPASVWAEATSS